MVPAVSRTRSPQARIRTGDTRLPPLGRSGRMVPGRLCVRLTFRIRPAQGTGGWLEEICLLPGKITQAQPGSPRRRGVRALVVGAAAWRLLRNIDWRDRRTRASQSRGRILRCRHEQALALGRVDSPLRSQSVTTSRWRPRGSLRGGGRRVPRCTPRGGSGPRPSRTAEALADSRCLRLEVAGRYFLTFGLLFWKKLLRVLLEVPTSVACVECRKPRSRRALVTGRASPASGSASFSMWLSCEAKRKIRKAELRSLPSRIVHQKRRLWRSTSPRSGTMSHLRRICPRRHPCS
mmetsp:Transcript_118868/g.272713  ORF Transcript_118868/g.272713 Transcript_118868/m.272713 type:complete len:292 (-) Transcript_118868:466-1341(-)